MDLEPSSILSLELPRDSIVLLDSIAEKQGVPKDEVARQAIELWLEQYRKYGPAFSRSASKTQALG